MSRLYHVAGPSPGQLGLRFLTWAARVKVWGYFGCGLGAARVRVRVRLRDAQSKITFDLGCAESPGPTVALTLGCGALFRSLSRYFAPFLARIHDGHQSYREAHSTCRKPDFLYTIRLYVLAFSNSSCMVRYRFFHSSTCDVCGIIESLYILDGRLAGLPGAWLFPRKVGTPALVRPFQPAESGRLTLLSSKVGHFGL